MRVDVFIIITKFFPLKTYTCPRQAQIKLGQSQYCTLDSPEDPCGSGSQTQCKEKCR